MSKKEKFVLEPVNNNCSKGYHWVVIKTQPIDAITKSGIVIPSNARLNSDAAEIVSLASECDCGLQEGDIILEPHNAGYPVTIEGVQYKIVSERDITCKYDTSRVKAKE